MREYVRFLYRCFRISFVGPTAQAPEPGTGDEIVDYSSDFVLPGLIDIHVHLSYGNAQANEDVDMYAPPEFRAPLHEDRLIVIGLAQCWLIRR